MVLDNFSQFKATSPLLILRKVRLSDTVDIVLPRGVNLTNKKTAFKFTPNIQKALNYTKTVISFSIVGGYEQAYVLLAHLYMASKKAQELSSDYVKKLYKKRSGSDEIYDELDIKPVKHISIYFDKKKNAYMLTIMLPTWGVNMPKQTHIKVTANTDKIISKQKVQEAIRKAKITINAHKQAQKQLLEKKFYAS